MLDSVDSWAKLAGAVATSLGAGLLAGSKIRSRISRDGLDIKESQGAGDLLENLRRENDRLAQRAVAAEERAMGAEMKRLQALEDNLKLQTTVRQLTQKVSELQVQVETLQKHTDTGNKLLGLALERMGLASPDELHASLENPA